MAMVAVHQSMGRIIQTAGAARDNRSPAWRMKKRATKKIGRPYMDPKVAHMDAGNEVRTVWTKIWFMWHADRHAHMYTLAQYAPYCVKTSLLQPRSVRSWSRSWWQNRFCATMRMRMATGLLGTSCHQRRRWHCTQAAMASPPSTCVTTKDSLNPSSLYYPFCTHLLLFNVPEWMP